MSAAGDDLSRVRQACEQLAQKPAAAWVAMLEPQACEADTVTFKPRPGERDVMNFATPPMQSRLAASLSEALGRKVRVQIISEDAVTLKADDSEAPEPNTSNDSPRDAARKLPLVAKALDVFPDATMMNARRVDDD